jgi:hypothetical protein
MEEKLCANCRFLQKYTSPKGTWVNVCEVDGAEEEDDGLYKVTVIDTDVFDASECLMYKKG